MRAYSIFLLATFGLGGCAADVDLGMQDIRPVGLELTCAGSGSHWGTVTNYSNNKNWKGKTTSSSSLVNSQYSGTIRYVESASGPMMSLPEGLMPGLNVGGGGKWRPVKDLVKTDSRISGRVPIGGLGAQADFVISRQTGDIKAETGNATFAGTCSAVAAGSGPRF